MLHEVLLFIYIEFIILLGAYLVSVVLEGEATTMNDEIDGLSYSIHHIHGAVFIASATQPTYY